MSISSDGPNAATTVSSIADGGDHDWTDQSNVLVDDANSAVASVLDVGESTHLLKLQGFGFDVPAAAPDLAVSADVRRNGDEVADLKIQLLDATGALAGDNKAAAGNWPISAGTATYGGSSDDWGLGAALTESLVEDADFGIGISAQAGASPPGIAPPEVEYVTLTVYYSVADPVLHDCKFPVELLAAVRHGQELPVEWAGIINAIVASASLPVEWQNTLASAAGLLAVEWQGGVSLAIALPLNWTAQPTVQCVLPASWRSTVTRTGDLPVDWSTRISAPLDVDLPVEWQTTIARGGDLPAAWLALRQIDHDGLFPVAWTANPGAEVTLAVEWLHAPQHVAPLTAAWRTTLDSRAAELPVDWSTRIHAQPAVANFPVEVLHAPRLQVALTVAWHARLSALHVVALPASWTATMAPHVAALDAETLATPPSAKTSIPVAWLRALEPRQENIAAAWLQTPGPVADLPVDWRATLAHAAPLPVESLQGLTRQAAAPVDWLESITTEVVLPAAWTASIAAPQAVPVQWLAGIVRGANLPVAWDGTTPVASTPAGWWEFAPRATRWEFDRRKTKWEFAPRATRWRFDDRSD